jgi:hypothetical protein
MRGKRRATVRYDLQYPVLVPNIMYHKYGGHYYLSLHRAVWMD